MTPGKDHAIILILTRTDGQWEGVISSSSDIPAESVPGDQIPVTLESLARGIAADSIDYPWKEHEM